MMRTDIPENAARYYDLSPEHPDDIPLYEQKIPFPEARLLELGCGTGRVLVPLADRAGYILGVDVSEAMLSVCRQKLDARGLPASRAEVQLGDITDLRVGKRFDLIIAPFRVFQTLETDREVGGFFQTIRNHLAEEGTAILNVFRPTLDRDRIRNEWIREAERLRWEVPFEGGRVTMHDRRPRMDRERLILYPELIYRRYRDDELVDQAVLKIAMRCYYPEDLLNLIGVHGFRVVDTHGGYAGERFGEGPELLVEFAGSA